MQPDGALMGRHCRRQLERRRVRRDHMIACGQVDKVDAAERTQLAAQHLILLLAPALPRSCQRRI